MSLNLPLQNKNILLTGASQGIGAETARILRARGASLVAHYRGYEERTDLVNVMGSDEDASMRFLAGDYRDDDQVDALWRDAVDWRGTIDVLVLNAAMMSPHGGVDDTEEEWQTAWREHHQVNVLAPARLMRAAVRHFRARGDGIIILISSWVAQRGASNPAMLPYAASKAAIKAVAQSIARGYADQGILTYILAPGIVRTRMSTDFAATQGGEDAVTQSLAMKAWVPPAEVGEIIAFLATGDAKHLSGATLDVNGASYIR